MAEAASTAAPPRAPATGASIDQLIDEAARQFNVDPRLVRAVMMTESSGRVNATGPVLEYGPDRGGRALGLMQLTPSIIRAYNVRDPMDPRESIFAGTRLLAENLQRYGDPSLAVQAYHGGTDQNMWGPRTRQHYERVLHHFTNNTPMPGAPRTTSQTSVAAAAVPAVPGSTPPSRPTSLPSDIVAQAPASAAPATADVDRALFGAPLPEPRAEPTTTEQEDTLNRLLVTGDPQGTQVPRAQNPAADTNFLQRFGAGFTRGMRDFADRPAELLAEGAERVGITPAIRGSTVEGVARDLGVPPILTGQEQRDDNTQARSFYDQNYGDSGWATTGRVVGQTLATAPVLRAGALPIQAGMRVAAAAQPALTGAANFVAGALPNNPLLRFGARAATGATAGAAGTALTLDPNQEVAPQIAAGAGGGAVGGAVLGPVVSAAGRGLRHLTSPAVNREMIDLAARARDVYGIRVPGTRLQSDFVQRADAAAGRAPGSGGIAQNNEVVQQFHDAVARQMGVPTGDRITSGVVQSARRSAGADMDYVAMNTANLAPDATFLNRFQQIAADARRTLTDLEIGPVRRNFDAISDVLQSNQGLNGEMYQRLTRERAPLHFLENHQNTNVRQIGRDLRKALDDLLERSNPDMADVLRDARRRYYIASEMKDFVDESGNFSPAHFARDFQTSELRPMRDLASIARHFVAPLPTSNTAENLMAMGAMFGGLPAAVALSNPSLALHAVGGAAAASALSRLTRSVTHSDWYRNRLIRAGQRPPAGPNGNSLLPSQLGAGAARELAPGDQMPADIEMEVTGQRPRR